MARVDGGAREGDGVMARSGGKPAAEVDFSNREQAAAWFRRQTGEVCIAFAARSALRVLPLIDAVRTRSRPDFAARVALPVLRACFVTWAIGRYPSRGDRWLGAARSVRNSIFSVRAYHYSCNFDLMWASCAAA